MAKRARFLFGIDPGEHTGLVCYDRQAKKIVEVRTDDFWGVYGYITLHDTDKIEVYIENPALNKFSYRRHTQEGKEALRIARNSGGNCREAELLIKGLQARGFNVKEIKPTQKKWDAETFKRYTGYTGSTNQHVRDAGALVFGL